MSEHKNDLWEWLKCVLMLLAIFALAVIGAKYAIEITADAVKNRKKYLYPWCAVVWIVFGLPSVAILASGVLGLIGLFGYLLIAPYQGAIEVVCLNNEHVLARWIFAVFMVFMGIAIDLMVLAKAYEYMCREWPGRTKEENLAATLVGLGACVTVAVILLLVR